MNARDRHHDERRQDEQHAAIERKRRREVAVQRIGERARHAASETLDAEQDAPRAERRKRADRLRRDQGQECQRDQCTEARNHDRACTSPLAIRLM